MTQIIYASIKNLDAPIGGVIVQAAHVAALHRAGFDAKISSTYEKGRPGWLDPEAPFVNGHSQPIRPGDVIVLHDSLPREIFDRFLTFPTKRVFFCQNHYFIDGTLLPGERLSDFPIDAFLCVSEPIAEYLRDVHGVPNPVIVRPAVRSALERSGPKKLQVCYMPRKRVVELAAVLYSSRYLYPELSEIPFVGIHRMHPDQVAQIMAESAIFLSLSEHEGLGLPPLEAMAAGCLVVGYHGGGGLDYATDDNGRWFDGAIPDNIPILLADTVRRIKDDPGALDRMVAAGKKTAARYSQAAMEKDLIAFWRSFL